LGVETLEIDFTDEASISEAAQKLGHDKRIDILINVAGEED
jgi:short-subunit dehydrogenase